MQLSYGSLIYLYFKITTHFEEVFSWKLKLYRTYGYRNIDLWHRAAHTSADVASCPKKTRAANGLYIHWDFTMGKILILNQVSNKWRSFQVISFSSLWRKPSLLGILFISLLFTNERPCWPLFDALKCLYLFSQVKLSRVYQFLFFDHWKTFFSFTLFNGDLRLEEKRLFFVLFNIVIEI